MKTAHRHQFGVKDIILLTLATSVIVWKFYPFLTGARTLLVAGGDSGDFSYPFLVSAARSLNQGSFPLWCNELFAGQPFAGHMQMPVFYPLHLLVWFLGFSPSDVTFSLWDWSFVLHVVIACWGAYLLARALGLRHEIAFAVSLFYALSPAYLGIYVWLWLFCSTAWYPVIMACAVMMLKEKNRRTWIWAALGGLAMGLCTLATTAQPAIMGLYMIGLYWLYKVGQNRLDRSFCVSATLKTTCFCAIGLMLAAAPLLLGMEYAGLSYRFGMESDSFLPSFADFTVYNLPTSQIYDLLMANGGFIYHGALPGILCICTLFLPVNKNMKDLTFFKMFFVIAFLQSFGIILPYFLYPVPMLNMVRESFLFARYLNITVPILAGYWLQWICEYHYAEEELRDKSAFYRQFAVFSAIASLGASYMYITFNRNRAFVLACAFVLFLGLWHRFGRRCDKYFGNIKLFQYAVAYGACLLFVMNIGTFMMFKPEFGESFLDNANQYYKESMPIADFVRPKDGELFRSHIVTGEANPMGVGHGAVLGFPTSFGYGNPVLKSAIDAHNGLFRERYCDLMNIRYTFMRSTDIAQVPILPLDASNFSIVAEFNDVMNSYQTRGTVYVYEKTNRPGHAWIVDKLVRVDTYEDGLLALNDPDFRVASEALIDTNDLVSFATSDEALISNVEISKYTTSSMALNVSTNKESLLVISELYYPGWQATADGKRVPIHKVDLFLRGILLAPGHHVVELSYSPTQLWIGLAIAMLALAGVVVLILYGKGVIIRRAPGKQEHG